MIATLMSLTTSAEGLSWDIEILAICNSEAHSNQSVREEKKTPQSEVHDHAGSLAAWRVNGRLQPDKNKISVTLPQHLG